MERVEPEFIYINTEIICNYESRSHAERGNEDLRDPNKKFPSFVLIQLRIMFFGHQPSTRRRGNPMTARAEPPPLDPTALARFGRLELIARLVVEGVMAGLHRSPFKGFSVEFAEHRQYGPGDEIRHIDWRAFGKTDRYYVKEYEEETNLKVYLVVDSSASMAYAGRTASKFEHARRLAASLAYLMIRQRDAVGLVTFDDSVRALIPARSAPGHFSVLCKALEETRTGGETPLSGILHALAERIER